MRSRTARRGQPLLFMSLILIGWVAMRAMTWQSPINYPASLSGFATGTIVNRLVSTTGDYPGQHAPARASANAVSQKPSSTSSGSSVKSIGTNPRVAEGRQSPSVPDGVHEHTGDRIAPAMDYWAPEAPSDNSELRNVDYWQGSSLAPMPSGKSSSPPVPTKIAAGHQLLMAAAFSQMELPDEIQAVFAQAVAAKKDRDEAELASQSTKTQTERATSNDDRWSIDGWLLLRSDEATALAATRPSYGRSQAGAVLRYRLDPGSRFEPMAFARATGALAGSSELDFAVGLSTRIDEAIPLRFAAEVRASETAAGWEARPAAYAVTELPLLELPFDLRGEAYAQAGYVGGRFDTAFVDGQLRVDRKLAEIGDTEVRVGAAGWGGAQEGAARLDLGPTASVSFKLGEARARVSADYRVRVAGDAQPRSGPAVTLTAGF